MRARRRLCRYCKKRRTGVRKVATMQLPACLECRQTRLPFVEGADAGPRH